MQTMLVPLDGSFYSEAVLPYAVSLSRAAPARMVLFSVWDWEGGEGRRSADYRAEELSENGLEHLRRYLQGVANRVANHVPAVNLEVREGGSAAEIIAGARNLSADIVVLATRGRRTLDSQRRASVTDKVINTAGVPVLTVNPKAAQAPADRLFAPIRRILVPLDLSPAGESAMGLAVEMARTAHAKVDLLHVVPGYDGWPQDDAVVVEAGDYLRARLTAYPDAVASVHVARGHPASAILGAAAQLGTDLIVMTSRGAGGGSSWPAGSVADEVIDGAVPTVVVPLQQA